MPPKKKKDVKALEELVKELQAELAETKRAKDRTNRVSHQCRSKIPFDVSWWRRVFS